MKKLFLFLLLAGLSSYGQITESETFSLSKEGATSVVVKIDSLKANDLYSRSKMYVQKTYKNPDFVIKADEYGKLLRFDGYEEMTGKSGSGGTYGFTCEIEFKDGRYKISFTDLYKNAGTYKIPSYDFFNSKGEIRHYKAYELMVENTIAIMNNVTANIKSFIITDKSSEW